MFKKILFILFMSFVVPQSVLFAVMLDETYLDAEENFSMCPYQEETTSNFIYAIAIFITILTVIINFIILKTQKLGKYTNIVSTALVIINIVIVALLLLYWN